MVDDEIGARGVIGESMNKRLRTMEMESESEKFDQKRVFSNTNQLVSNQTHYSPFDQKS
jgi:hypothetical protein